MSCLSAPDSALVFPPVGLGRGAQVKADQGSRLSEARPSSSETPLFAVSLPKGASTVGSGFSFDLPESVRSMAGADAGIQVTQADGSPPPDWLKFDLVAMRFEALGVPDGAFPMQLVLVIEGQRVTVVISERT
jgi:hypothetical protein